MNFYCKELKENKYLTVYEFLKDFYGDAHESDITHYEDDTVQCKRNKGRSIDDLMKLCSYHLGKDIELKELVEALHEFHNEECQESSIIYCDDIHKIVFSPSWNPEDNTKQFINSGSHYCYTVKHQNHDIDEDKFMGKYTIQEIEEIVEQIS